MFYLRAYVVNPFPELSESNGGTPEVVIEDIRSWNGDCAEPNGDALESQYPSVINGDSQELVPNQDHETKYEVPEENASLILPESDAMSVFGAEGEMSFSVDESQNEAFNAKVSALLTLEPTNCFVPHSEEQKLFHSVMYDLARQMVAKVDVAKHGPNSPMHRAHFKKSLEEFLNAYLSDFLARVPQDFRVEKKGRVFTPMALIRKCCNDCFRALLRRKFRQACLAANTPVPFTFH